MQHNNNLSTPQLVIALDLPSLEENLRIARFVRECSNHHLLWLKIGLRAFIRDGIAGIESIRKASGAARIFLDVKLYDIPNTMADAAQECADLGVDMLTIHASAGLNGMRAVMERVRDYPMLVMAVSALTSFDNESWRDVYGYDIDSSVRYLSTQAEQAGVSGMVCSVLESRAIKSTSPTLLTLTPGIRTQADSSDDQKRVATIEQAVRAGADFLVIGRPIYTAHNPQAAIESAITHIIKSANV